MRAADQLGWLSACEGADWTGFGACTPCGGCWAGILAGSAGFTGGVRICWGGEGDRAAAGGNTAAGGWAAVGGAAAWCGPPLTCCCWGTGGDCLMGDRPPLGGGSGEDPASGLASRDWAGVSCRRDIEEGVMLLTFPAEPGRAIPFEAAGGASAVFVCGGEGRCGCFDGEVPLPLPANVERAALDATFSSANPG